MEEKNYITPFGLKRLVDERDFLLKIERPKIVSVVSMVYNCFSFLGHIWAIVE